MDKSIFLNNINKISEEDLEIKLGKILNICKKILLKKDNKYHILLIDNNIYTINPKKLSAKIVNKLFSKLKLPVTTKPVCANRVYIIAYENYILYNIYESFPLNKLKIIYNDLFCAYFYEKLYTVENIDTFDVNFAKVIKIRDIYTNNYFPPKVKKNLYPDLDLVFVANNILITDNLNEIARYAANNNVKYKIENVPILSDLRLKRIILYDTKTYFIYNSGEYQLIPFFNIGNIKVGTLFVCLRFQFVNNIINLINLINNKVTLSKQSIPNYNIKQEYIFAELQNYYGIVVDIRSFYKNECDKELPYNPRILGQIQYSKNK